MDMTGFLGKKIDLELVDGKKYSGYVVNVSEADDSEIGEDSIDLDPLDRLCAIILPVREIKSVVVDTKYREFDFAS